MIRPIHMLPILGMVYLIAQAPAHAGTLSRATMDGFAVSISGRSATFGWENPDSFSTRLAALPPAGSLPAQTVGTTALRAGADGIYATTTARPTLGGKLVPITGTAKLTPLSVGKAVGKFAYKLATPVAIGMGLLELAKDLGIGLRDKDGLSEWFEAGQAGGGTPAVFWSHGSNPSRMFQDPLAACAATYKDYGSSFRYEIDPGNETVASCFANSSYVGDVRSKKYCYVDNQWTIASGSTCPGETKPDKILTEQDLADKIAAQSGWPSSSQAAAANATAAAINAGQSVEAGPVTITGPASAEVSKKTTTSTDAQGNPVSKTETTTNNYTYEGNKVTTTTTTTIINNTTNQVESKTETETEKEEPAPTDTNLPDLPKLYERKYPDGIVGVWNEKSAELKATPVMSLAKSLMPTVNGGSCPQFMIPLDFASWASFGTADVSPPCELWTFGKMVIIISALILARALIFGG